MRCSQKAFPEGIHTHTHVHTAWHIYRTSKCMMMEVRNCTSVGSGNWLEEHIRDFSEVMKMFSVLFLVVATWMYPFVRVNETNFKIGAFSLFMLFTTIKNEWIKSKSTKAFMLWIHPCIMIIYIYLSIYIRASPPWHYWHFGLYKSLLGSQGKLSHALYDVYNHPWPQPTRFQ